MVCAVPAARPVLVRPAHAERKIGLAGLQHFVERPLEQPPAVEPVVVVAKAVDAVFAREIRLRDPRLRNAQVVEPEIGGKMRLIVALELRLRANDVAPFGEALAPPGVVLRNRVELRKIERDQLRQRHGDRSPQGRSIRVPGMPAPRAARNHSAISSVTIRGINSARVVEGEHRSPQSAGAVLFILRTTEAFRREASDSLARRRRSMATVCCKRHTQLIDLHGNSVIFAGPPCYHQRLIFSFPERHHAWTRRLANASAKS